MKNIDRRRFLRNTGLTGLTLLSAGSPAMAGLIRHPFSPRLRSVMLADNGKALINPDMGWTLHYYSNSLTNYGSRLEPSDTLDDFPGLSVIYLRIAWSFIEAEEGKYNWEVIDTPAQRWIDKGKKIALRITCYENFPYATPQWVEKAGAKTSGTPGRRDHPDFCDPVFLEKLENFLSAMASRYDGNPHVAFVDIGSLGIWGEGHSAGSSGFCISTLEMQKKHVDLHCKYFKKTLIAIGDDFAGTTDITKQHFPITDYALSKGLTLRDDSIMVLPPPEMWFSAGISQLFWPTRPVIIETEHYGSSKARNAFTKELLLRSVEEYHASYMSIHYWPREFLQEMKEGVDMVNKRMGYRIQLREITWPDSIKLGEPFSVSASLANVGVAPCYPGGYPCITLKDRKGGIVSVLVDQNVNVKNLKVGKPDRAPVEKINSNFTVSPTYKIENRVSYTSTKPGEYDIYFSIGESDGTPLVELPYDSNDGHKRYKLGTIKVTAREAGTAAFEQ
jgi:hypothetical protein